MSKKLAATTFVRNGDLFDYNYMETIAGLLEVADHVFCVAVHGEDETVAKLLEIKNDRLTIIVRESSEWDAQKGTGSSKLCYFSDIAIKAAEDAGYEYNLYVQADECISEKSYAAVREAIATGAEAFMVRRVNLWNSPYQQLDVPHNRLPCSNEIIRLAKCKYRTYGDGESLAVPYADFTYLNAIRLYHMGFVRKAEVMRDKIINMQVEVFEGDYDKKLDITGKFQPEFWFTDADLKVIDEPLPLLIQDWARERYESNLKA